MRSADGKRYLTDVVDTEQLFRLIQSQDSELYIEQAMTDYRRWGYLENWINQRIKFIEIRKELTGEWNDAD